MEMPPNLYSSPHATKLGFEAAQYVEGLIIAFLDLTLLPLVAESG